MDKDNVNKSGNLISYLVVFFIALYFANKMIPGPSSKPVDFSKAILTEQNIRIALKNEVLQVIPSDHSFPADIIKINIKDNPDVTGQKDIEIFFEPEFWDETHLVKIVGGTMIKVGKTLFINPEIETITLLAVVDMVNKYGQSSKQIGVKIKLSRQLASKVNWAGLAEYHTLDPGNIYRLADDYLINPGIARFLNWAEINFDN